MSALRDDKKTWGKIQLNYKRNKKQDQTENIDAAAAAFDYEACKDEPWNPERFALLWGTPLWDGATARQRVQLNQLYWVAYYSQIISAEIATIFFNQTSAAGLYGMEDFRVVCDMLDLESSQERAHINAFRTVGRQVEQSLFGRPIFGYAMRNPYAETMIFPDSSKLRRYWKNLQLRAFGMLSSGNAFVACQYFTVRGIRTLNGKIVQHQLSRYYTEHADQARAPLPAAISYHHFLDESYHFTSSTVISQDIVKCLPKPTRFEREIANLAITGCQRDHYHFSIVVNGIFWHDPATFQAMYEVLRSPVFGFDDRDAREMMRRCFCEDSEGLQAAYATHRTAVDSYRAYVADMDHVSADNKAMRLMGRSTVAEYLADNRAALARFSPAA
jgi:hypothetical protein